MESHHHGPINPDREEIQADLQGALRAVQRVSGGGGSGASVAVSVPGANPIPLCPTLRDKTGRKVAIVDGWLHHVEVIGGRPTLMQCPPSLGFEKGCVTYALDEQSSVCAQPYASKLLAWLTL